MSAHAHTPARPGRRLHLQDHYDMIAETLPPGAGLRDAIRAAQANTGPLAVNSRVHREAHRQMVAGILRGLESRNSVSQ